jgi:hypothetical protein
MMKQYVHSAEVVHGKIVLTAGTILIIGFISKNIVSLRPKLDDTIGLIG